MNPSTKKDDRGYLRNNDNVVPPLDEDKDDGAMVGITSNDKVLLGNCIDSESNKNNWRWGFPKNYRRESIKVTWKFSKI